MDQMDLAQVGLWGVVLHSPQMLRGPADMTVPFDSETFQERDGGLCGLGETVARTAEDAEDGRGFFRRH